MHKDADNHVTSLHFACPYNTNNETQKLRKLKQQHNIIALNQ